MCKCIALIDKELKSKGYELDVGYRMGKPPLMMIKILSLDGRKIKLNLYATHCPICGEKYE